MRKPSEQQVHVDDDFLLDLAHGLIDARAAESGSTTESVVAGRADAGTSARADPRVEHLQSCASCDRRLQDHVRTRERLRAAGPPRPAGETREGAAASTSAA